MTGVDWSWLTTINLWQVAVVIVALWLVTRMLIQFWPALKRIIALVDALSKLPDFMDQTSKKIAEIHHEVKYNNGSSVKDAIRRVEHGVKDLNEKVDSLEDPTSKEQ